jgi:hypothetical protein
MRTESKRFIFPAKLDQKPEVGRYDPNDNLTAARLPQWDFGKGHKMNSLKVNRGNSSDPFAHQDMSSTHMSFTASVSSFAGTGGSRDSTSSHPAKTFMASATKRPDLGKISHLVLTEMPNYGGVAEWKNHDKRSSALTRVPDWDFEKHSGSHDFNLAGDTYYEPDKYSLSRMSAVDTASKAAVDFSHDLGRHECVGQLGHASPKAVLQKDDEIDASAARRRKAPREPNPVIPDRSLHRSCPATRPFKVQSVTEFSKQTPRPPISPSRLVYHDEQDLEASASVMQRALSYDAVKADRLIIPRRDYAPRIDRSLPRQKGWRGVRLLEGDLSHQMGRAFNETKTQLQGDMHNAKESPNHPRRDLGVAFSKLSMTKRVDMNTGERVAEGLSGAASPLRRRRSMAAPIFARTAPFAGFAPRMTVARPATTAVAGAGNTAQRFLATCSTELHDDAEAFAAPCGGRQPGDVG